MDRRRSVDRSRSRTLSRSSTPDRRGKNDDMDVDDRREDRRPGELKIKGQAAAERRQNKRDGEDKVCPMVSLPTAGPHPL